MKVFLSWSGKLSHQVALALREWLPCVMQFIRPWVSSEDIEKGTRWSTDIAKELKDTTYGIFCITKENLAAPWVNFEAGAISKLIAEANVSPFLIDIQKSDVQGPLAQFQLTIVEKADVSKLIHSINGRAAAEERIVDPQLLDRVFDHWWPNLESSIKELIGSYPNVSTAKDIPAAKSAVILEELLELARNQQRLVANPPALLPPEYLTHVIERALIHRRHFGGPGDSFLYKKLHRNIIELESMLSLLCDKHSELKQAMKLLKEIHECIHEFDGELQFRKSLRSSVHAREIDRERAMELERLKAVDERKTEKSAPG